MTRGNIGGVLVGPCGLGMGGSDRLGRLIARREKPPPKLIVLVAGNEDTDQHDGLSGCPYGRMPGNECRSEGAGAVQ